MRIHLVRVAFHPGWACGTHRRAQIISAVFVFLAAAGLSYSQTSEAPTNRVLRPITPRLIVETGAVARSTSVLAISPRLLQSPTLKVISRGPSGQHATTNTVNTSKGTIQVENAPGTQHIVLPMRPMKPVALSDGKNSFPGSIYVSTTGDVLRHGELFLKPTPAILAWIPTAQVYSAKLKVGLDLTNHQASVPLVPAITVQFVSSNCVVEPDSLVISRTEPEGYQEAVISCQPHQRHASIVAVSDLGSLPMTVTVEGFDLLGALLDIFPVPFLFAALIGGTVGGLLRCLHRPLASGKARRTLEGVIVGLIVTGAVSVGIHVGDFSRDIVNQPMGVFIVAALAGYAGTTILDRLTNRILNLTDDDAKKPSGSESPVAKQ